MQVFQITCQFYLCELERKQVLNVVAGMISASDAPAQKSAVLFKAPGQDPDGQFLSVLPALGGAVSGAGGGGNL